MSQLDRFYRDHQSDVGLLVVALQDQPDSVRSLMQQAGASFPVLLDPQGDVAGRYGIAAVPTIVIVDKQGRIADVKVGPTTAADLESATNALK